MLAISITSCQKSFEFSDPDIDERELMKSFTKYHIPQGKQYAENNTPIAVDRQELKFQVRFDNSAIYKTADPSNQDDINKLYGFSDNSAQHHQFSARIGWRWSGDSLRLFAYIYNNSVRISDEITTVAIGKINDCSIKVNGNRYIFTVNNSTILMPRAATTPQASGYKLYPYFGGDEVAPHDIDIWIKEVF